MLPRPGPRWTATASVAAGLSLALLAGCSSAESWAPGSVEVDHQPVLGPWFEAVREADSEAANIVVLGDSVSEGFGLQDPENRWIDLLQRGLREKARTPDCPTGPAGYHGTTSLVPAHYQATSLPSPTVRGEAMWAPEVGPGGRAVRLHPGASVTWTVEASGVDVGYRTVSGGGRLEIRVDGERAREGTRSTAVEDKGGRAVWSSGWLGPGKHVVTARNISSRESKKPVTVTDLTPYRGDRNSCVHVLDASRSGVALNTITKTPGYLADSLSLRPDLLMVALGFNDIVAGASAREFGQDLDTLVRQSRELGYEGPILVIGWFTPDLMPWMPSWRDYLDQMQRATRHEGVSFVDLSAVLPPVEEAKAGIYLDSVHPSAKGQPMISDALIPALAPRPEPPTSSSSTAAAVRAPDARPTGSTPGRVR